MEHKRGDLGKEDELRLNEILLETSNKLRIQQQQLKECERLAELAMSNAVRMGMLHRTSGRSTSCDWLCGYGEILQLRVQDLRKFLCDEKLKQHI